MKDYPASLAALRDFSPPRREIYQESDTCAIPASRTHSLAKRSSVLLSVSLVLLVSKNARYSMSHLGPYARPEIRIPRGKVPAVVVPVVAVVLVRLRRNRNAQAQHEDG